jgi:hypothetical protein
LWLDCDIVVEGKLDEMFDNLDDHDVSIPNFCGWISSGRTMAKRVKKFKGIADQKYIDKALEENPAVNTGILSFRKSEKWTKFVTDWVELADKGAKKRIFIPDEVAFQVLYPSASDWGLDVHIAPQKYNVSVKYGTKVEDKRVVHFHGKKHCLDFPNCDYWKNEFESMRENNTANINSFIKYADKRLSRYLKVKDGLIDDVTIVTACDEKYIEFLKLTFPNWRKYKNIDKYPVIVFVHGIPLDDERLDFLKLPNVELIEWSFPEAVNDKGEIDHREEMLSAFVFGAAENVRTDYWLKLDCDSFATDDRPLYDESMKQYAYCGHKWGYSRPHHINALDEWAKGHWRRKLKKAGPMINEGRIEGRRFYHEGVKRTISFIQLHKLKFTKFCVGLCRERRLPVPTQDTFMFFVCNRFDPHLGGTANFKRNHGFTQGNSRRPVEQLKEKLRKVEIENGFMLEDGTVVEDDFDAPEDTVTEAVETPQVVEIPKKMVFSSEEEMIIEIREVK